MKSYSAQYDRNQIPWGREMPRAPVEGELFRIIADQPDPENPGIPWYSRGSYVFNGVSWQKLIDAETQRVSKIIPSMSIEIAAPFTSKEVPSASTPGYEISMLSIKPSNRRATIAGFASFWVDHNKGGDLIIAVFRGTKLIGISVESLQPGASRSLGVSFEDIPGSSQPQHYSIKVYSDTAGDLFVNQSAKYLFNGFSQTAFIAQENI